MNKVNWFQRQRVKNTDKLLAQENVVSEFNALNKYVNRNTGFSNGGHVIETDPVSNQVKLAFFYGMTYGGNPVSFFATINPTTWLTLNLTNTGYTALAPTSPATGDGSLITVGTGKKRWVTIIVQHFRNTTDLRPKPDFTTINFQDNDSYKLLLLAGDEFTAAGTTINDNGLLKKPAIPENRNDILILADVLLYNDAGVVKTDHVSHMRKTPEEQKPIPTHMLGSPVLISKFRIAEDVGTETFGEGYDLDDRELMDFGGTLMMNTRGGALNYTQDSAATTGLRNGIEIMWPIYNTSTGNLTIQPNFKYRDSLHFNFTALPNTGDYALYDVAFHDVGDGTIQTYSPTITVPPGRSMMRAWFVNTRGGAFHVAQLTEIYDTRWGIFRWIDPSQADKTIHDYEQIAHLMGAGTYLGTDAVGWNYSYL